MNSDNPLLHGGDINPYAGEVVTLPPFVVSESRLRVDPMAVAVVLIVVFLVANRRK